jgi:hypothetical protein
VRSKGWNCHVPFPFAKRIKLTCSEGGFYYHANGRLVPGPVAPFAAGTPAASAAALRQTAAALRDEHGRRRTGWTMARGGPLGPQETLFTESGPGVLVRFALDVGPVQNSPLTRADVLRGVLLVVECDGHETVRVPVGDFFGSAPDGHPYLGHALSVDEQGNGCCLLPMPVHEQIALRLVNECDGAVTYGFRHEFARKEDLPKDALALHVAWHQQKDVRTRPRRDHLVLDATGPGRFVGTTLVVRNPVRTWWGEGDEKFLVDGEAFPSTFGTGTEDFFGYAWCSNATFASAFHAQPQCDGPGNRGYTCVNRFLLAEAVPFQKSFRFDLEVWHWKDCAVDYATTAYWYAPAAAKSGLPAVPPAAERRKVPLPPPVTARVPGAIELETLPVLALTGGKTQVQDMTAWDGAWSEGKQLWWTGAHPGDRLTLGLPVEKAGTYRVKVQLTKASDYGFVQVLLDDAELGTFQDLYASEVGPSGVIDLGVVELGPGQRRLGFELVGRNAKAKPGYMVGVDYVLLEPVAK